MAGIYSKQISILVFIALQLGIVLVHISKNALWIKASYKIQKYEREYQTCIEEKKIALQRLYVLKNHGQIKQYAQKELGMNMVALGKIKKVS